MSVAASSSFLASPGGALIASASAALREQMLQQLYGKCRPLQQAVGGADALAKLEKGAWQTLFLDRSLPDLDAEELMAIIRRRFPELEVVWLDSAARVASTGRPEAVRDPDPPRPEPPRIEPLPGMIGASEAMQKVYRLARLVAPRSTTVLIEGPTGTGKELVARALHALSPRATKPLIVVNCAAIPESLLESELFGYTRGAFTGAVQSQPGRISAAQGGTLFLDEVSELPLSMQAKLLRFLEQKEIQRLGSTETMRVDVRVIAASNANLAARAMRGDFRQDLFYRLAVFPLELPPLAARHTDIVPMAEHFLACMAAALDTRAPSLSTEAARILASHAWKGNVRELQHVMERASILVEAGDCVQPEHLVFTDAQGPWPDDAKLGATPLSGSR